MLTVHHLNESRSQRILWLLEELGLPYEIAFHTRDPKTRLAPPSLTDVHPLGKSPVIVDRTPEGARTIIESGAIIDYVIRRHGEGRLAPIRPAPTTTVTSSGCTMPKARPCCR
jgi:glutathione S-transferase